MKGIDKFVSIHLCVEPVDFRKGQFILAALIQSEFGENPLSENLFLFICKNKKSMRAVIEMKQVLRSGAKHLNRIDFLGLKALLRIAKS